jgi:ribose transport system substrate-binding protein
MTMRRHTRRLTYLFASVTAVLAAMACGSAGSASGGPSSATPSSASSGASSSADANLAQFQQAVNTYYKGQVTAPPATAPKYDKPVNAWIISCGQASEGCADPTAAMKAAAQALGWKTTVVDGNFGAADAYNAAFRQAVAAGANVVLETAVNCDQAKTGLQAAKAAHIVVVGADAFDCTDPKVNAGTQDLMSATVSFNQDTPTTAATEEARGRARADWIIVHTNGQAKVINLVFAGLTAGEYQNEGFLDELSKCTTCKIVDTINYTPTDTANGTLKQAFASALAKYPDANAAPVTDDGIVQSADLAQVIQSAGRTGDFCLVSGGGYAVNNQLIRQGRGECAEAVFDVKWLGWAAVDEALRLLAGQPTVPEGLGVQLYDASHGMPAPGENYTAAVDYKALYEKAWGVS